MSKDIWHYPRTALASQVIEMFAVDLSSALVFFAPRRMGKTEFLLKDIKPLAIKKGFSTLYFSFLDSGDTAQEDFTKALLQFANEMGIKTRLLKSLKHLKKINGKFAGFEAGIEFENDAQLQASMKEIIEKLAKRKKIMLLIDEIQVLAKHESNSKFIASLRTILDINKDSIKVIFTGSSQAGLRKMFSKADAPFFHFGQNLPFPVLDKAFTDHLASCFIKVTKRQLSKPELWKQFQDLQYVPQLIRALVERLALHPSLSIKQAKEHLIANLIDDRQYVAAWKGCSRLERLILHSIVSENHAVFSQTNREAYAQALDLPDVTVPNVQSAIRSLQRRELISRIENEHKYAFDDPNFERWILEQDQS